MAFCDLLNGGLNLDCTNNTGGITNIYVADFKLITGTTETAGSLSAIGLSGGTAAFYEFEFHRNSSSYEEVLNTSTNGGSFYAQTVNLVLSKRQKIKREVLVKLTAGQKRLFVIVKDSNGLYFAIGSGEGAIVSAIAGGSGIAKGDANVYNVTFTAEENNSIPEVTLAIVAGLLA